ncbi:hypothetical protein A3A93_06105 [Candidatus Roizmanbacteria bacterium RIFCSPLOWO2_01_FULL_38_12]|uniref:rRNA maturation RNase YbeY n=1 Tax=Candidatus Roizmanbacteria bacterium RIFCSPLOWO2_01_FULL_38_12 TaxID=1802061 RepID=A0A1F7IU06_9BACT|nr:MAG: hypothetical protein A3F59_01585 [Candidatus Roizmanbacteria bacterium RIFCSPHIGHO2_12_FULL_38_13]OGK46804.1 MAG: hypothetical protein A3A93_06105 [Candidatus Roizmanbacteria bacterium RIFCSPLOWO2_01_FULL_38_12]
MINIYGSSRYKINKKGLKKFAQSVLDRYQIGKIANVNIALVGKRKMIELASKYKDENVALPVLSFSYYQDKTTSDNTLGEVVICYPQAVILAAQREKRVDQMFNTLVEHGIQNLFTK